MADDIYPALRPRTVFEEHMLLPFKLAISRGRSRVADLVRRTSTPAFLAQYPGKTVNAAYSMLFDVDLVAARRHGAEGFLGHAPVVDLAKYVTPRDNNVVIGRDGAFYHCETTVAAYVSLTYDDDPSFAAGHSFTNPLPVGDLFDRAVEANGGGLQLGWFFGHQSYEDKPNLAFDVVLHDKKRGKRLHEGHIPPHLLVGRERPRPVRYEPGSEIEPRVRLLEVRMGDLLDTDAAWNAAQFRAYLNITFHGFKVLA